MLKIYNKDIYLFKLRIKKKRLENSNFIDSRVPPKNLIAWGDGCGRTMDSLSWLIFVSDRLICQFP